MKTILFINIECLINSEYKINIFKLPSIICNHLSKLTKITSRIIKKYIFMPTPSTESQMQLMNIMIQDKFDVVALDYMNKMIDVAMATKMVSDAYKNIYDVGVIIGGNISLCPAIKETRNMGKQILMVGFQDKIDPIYKETNYETGPFDFDILYLDSILNIIADKIIDSKITPSTVLEEVKLEFFDGNINFSKIDVKKYITYWATRARYLQLHQNDMSQEDQEMIKRMFDRLNTLSIEKRPGYIKALNKKWQPSSWESELSIIPKVW